MRLENESPRVFTSGRHIPQLDGVRGLAILLVTLYRFGHDCPTETTVGYIFAQLFHLGSHGVELFFVLSGFLITGILIDSHGAPGQLKSFFVRRALRIFPLYFAALAVMALLIPILLRTERGQLLASNFSAAYDQQVYLWLYLTNVRMSIMDSWCFGPLDHCWSLAVEEHFYLVWPAVVILCWPRNLLRLTVLAAVAVIAMRTIWLVSGGRSTAAEVFTLFRCEGLLMGAAIAIWIRQPELGQPHRVRMLIVASACLVVGALLDMSQRRWWMLGTICWTCGWSALMLALLGSCPHHYLARWLARPALCQLGKFSYAMYLFQTPLIPVMAWCMLLVGLEPQAAGLAGHLAYMAGMMGLTFSIAWTSWHLYEKHWIKLKARFPQTRAAAMPTQKDVPHLDRHAGDRPAKGSGLVETWNGGGLSKRPAGG